MRGSCGAVAFLTTAAFLFALPASVSAGVTAGPLIDLHWGQVDFAFGGVALLADGSFAATTQPNDVGGSQLQFFSADGVLVSTTLLADNLSDYITVGSLGANYLTVVQRYRDEGDGPQFAYRHAFAQLYDRAGQPLGAQFFWPRSVIPYFGSYYRFGGAPQWDFLPITYALAPFLIGGYPYYLSTIRIGSPGPVRDRPPLLIAPEIEAQVEDAAINGHGDFVVLTKSPPSWQRGLQMFRRGGAPITPVRSAVVPQTNFSARVAINPRQQVLLAFFGPSGTWAVRLYDHSGSPASVPIEFPAETGSPVSPRDMIGLTDGSFVIAWEATRVRSGDTLVIARFDPQARRFGAPLVVATTPSYFHNTALRLNADGAGIVVWQSEAGPFGPFSGYARRISVAP